MHKVPLKCFLQALMEYLTTMDISLKINDTLRYGTLFKFNSYLFIPYECRANRLVKLRASQKY